MLQTRNQATKNPASSKLSRRERSVRASRRLGEKLEAHAEARQGRRLDADALRRRLRVSWDRLRPFGVKPPSERSAEDTRYPLAAFREEFASTDPPAVVAEEAVPVFYVRTRSGEVSRRFFGEEEAMTWARVKNSGTFRDGGEPLWYVERLTAAVRPEGGGDR